MSTFPGAGPAAAPAGPPQGSAPQQGAAGQPQGAGLDTHALLGLASTAEEALVKLASGLAHAGAQPGTVTAVHQLADMTRQIVVALSGAGAQAGQQQPQPGAPAAQATPQDAPQHTPPPTMDAATRHLHEVMQVSAARRQGGLG